MPGRAMGCRGGIHLMGSGPLAVDGRNAPGDDHPHHGEEHVEGSECARGKAESGAVALGSRPGVVLPQPTGSD